MSPTVVQHEAAQHSGAKRGSSHVFTTCLATEGKGAPPACSRAGPWAEQPGHHCWRAVYSPKRLGLQGVVRLAPHARDPHRRMQQRAGEVGAPRRQPRQRHAPPSPQLLLPELSRHQLGCRTGGLLALARLQPEQHVHGQQHSHSQRQPGRCRAAAACHESSPIMSRVARPSPSIYASAVPLHVAVHSCARGRSEAYAKANICCHPRAALTLAAHWLARPPLGRARRF